MKSAELEMITQCKLQLSNISRQRHHAGLAVNSAFSAMKVLRSANVFKDKKMKKTDIQRCVEPSFSRVTCLTC